MPAPGAPPSAPGETLRPAFPSARLVRNPMTDTRPICHVVAGPNGSGKSTFALRYLPRWAGAVEYVNPVRAADMKKGLGL